jgi:predicted amidohydrolase
MYDLLLKGGTVIDPSRNVHEKLDVAVTGDRITKLDLL